MDKEPCEVILAQGSQTSIQLVLDQQLDQNILF